MKESFVQIRKFRRLELIILPDIKVGPKKLIKHIIINLLGIIHFLTSFDGNPRECKLKLKQK